MDGFYTNKKYESVKIQGRQEVQGDRSAQELSPMKHAKPLSSNDGPFYEIEYGSCPIPGVGKFVLKAQKIEEPKKDEKRELFGQMRDIARAHRSQYDINKFYDRRVQQDNAFIFYKQGMFMKDFTDDYSSNVQFSQYFPYYQQMGYEQLRTYFTWRTKVREGNVTDTSLSYTFLYIYELLSNIGVSDPQDGLHQLMTFWSAFTSFNKSLDRYVIRWLKDYHIYYELPHSFKEFIDTNNLSGYYPKMAQTVDNFTMFCNISKYDIRKSTFFTGDKEKLVIDCFYYLMDEIKKTFEDNGIDFDKAIFQNTKKMSEWRPFKDALFYPWKKQTDRRIVLSENEIFICSNNKWSFSTVLSSDHGRQLIGYILKQMEVALRKLTNYKFKLSANINMVAHEAIDQLNKVSVSLETIINNAVVKFYKEATKTVVVVDQTALARIRQEALATQEKLIVEEQGNVVSPIAKQGKLSKSEQQGLNLPETDKLHVPEQQRLNLSGADKLLVPEQQRLNLPDVDKLITPEQKGLIISEPVKEDQIFAESLVSQQLTLSFDTLQDEAKKSLTEIKSTSEIESTPEIKSISEIESTPISNSWYQLKNALTEVEINALSVVLHGNQELKKYSDECKIMLEVLVDGINEKAMDFIGDNLLDEEFVLYDDYKEQVKDLIE